MGWVKPAPISFKEEYYMANNNDVVIINLDRPREVRYGHRALKTLCAMLGKSFEDMGQVLANPGPEELEQIMYCGLLSDAKKNDEVLKLEQMEDLLDLAQPYTDITDAMNKAIEMAFPEVEEIKNPQGTVKNPKK